MILNFLWNGWSRQSQEQLNNRVEKMQLTCLTTMSNKTPTSTLISNGPMQLLDRHCLAYGVDATMQVKFCI